MILLLGDIKNFENYFQKNSQKNTTSVFDPSSYVDNSRITYMYDK